MKDQPRTSRPSRPMLNAVAEYLTQEEWNFDRDEEAGTITSTVEADSATFCVRFALNEKDAVAGFLVFNPTQVPGEKYLEVLELLNLVNCRIFLGNFELDREESKVRFRLAYDLEGSALSQEMIRNMLCLGIGAYDRFFPMLMAVCFGNESPARALVGSSYSKDS